MLKSIQDNKCQSVALSHTHIVTSPVAVVILVVPPFNSELVTSYTVAPPDMIVIICPQIPPSNWSMVTPSP